MYWTDLASNPVFAIPLGLKWKFFSVLCTRLRSRRTRLLLPVSNFPLRYNIAPTDQVPIPVQFGAQQREIDRVAAGLGTFRIGVGERMDEARPVGVGVAVDDGECACPCPVSARPGRDRP